MDAQPESPPIKFEVISINCWGLKFISKHRRARLTEIGARLASRSPPPQLVGLQECWTQDDYQSIRQQTSTILPHGKYYHGGIFGAGLAILSRWPIEESSMVGYPLNGRPTAFFRGDWFVGKGVACAKIRFGPGCRDVAEVFCTHVSSYRSSLLLSLLLAPSLTSADSFMPHTNVNHMTPTSAIEPHRPGRSQS